jgi:hypothetical protein
MGDEDYDTAGLDPSDVGIVGPCGHDLPLSVAVRSASAGAAGASGVAAATATTAAALVAAAGAKHPSRHRAGAAAPRSCPTCGGQIASVEDGLARKGRPAVVFRYSNCLYALSVAAPPSSAASPSGPSAVTSWQSSASLNQQLLRGTAQGRIAEALGLASLKVRSEPRRGKEKVKRRRLVYNRHARESSFPGGPDKPRKQGGRAALLRPVGRH